MKRKLEVKTKAQHYREALSTIIAIGADYDGYRTAKGLRGLVDDLVFVAANGLNHKPVYFTGVGEPAYRIK